MVIGGAFQKVIQDAIDAVCAKILDASNGEQIVGVFLYVQNLGGKRRNDFLAIGPDNWYNYTLGSNWIKTNISTTEGTDAIIPVTKRILASIVPVSKTKVEISVRFRGARKFRWDFFNTDRFPKSEGAAYKELVAIFRLLPTRQEFLDWQNVRDQWMNVHHKQIDHQRVFDILYKYPTLTQAFLDFGQFHHIDNGPYIPSVPPIWCMLASPNSPTLDVLQRVYQNTSFDFRVDVNAIMTNDGKVYSTLYFSLLLEPSVDIVSFIYNLAPFHINNASGNLARTDADNSVFATPLCLLLANIEAGRANLCVLKELRELCPDILQKMVFHKSRLMKAYEVALCSSSREVLSWIAQRMDSTLHQGILRLHEDFVLDPERLDHLRRFLPELHVFEVDAKNWSPDAAALLLIKLVKLERNETHKKKMKDLCLKNIPLRLVSCELLQQLLQQDSALESIYLSASTTEDVPQALATIFRALITSENKNLESFLLCGTRDFPSWETIFPLGQEITLANRSLKKKFLGGSLLHADVYPGLLGFFHALTSVELVFAPNKGRAGYSLKECMHQIM